MSILDELIAEISDSSQQKTDKKMSLARYIADGIKKKSWTKQKFAEMMGKKPSEISRWLSGTHNFTTDTMIDIEEVLEIKLINTSAPVLMDKVNVENVFLVVNSASYSETLTTELKEQFSITNNHYTEHGIC